MKSHLINQFKNPKIAFCLVLSVFIAGACNAKTTVTAQDTVDIAPEWHTTPVQKPGYIYGTGRATSTDLAMAKQKAEHFASTDLAENYPGKFSTFEKKCDSIIDSETQQQMLTTLVKKSTEVQLVDIETMDQKVINENGTYIVYIQKRVSISTQVGALKKAISNNADLKKTFRQKQLMAELDKL